MSRVFDRARLVLHQLHWYDEPETGLPKKYGATECHFGKTTQYGEIAVLLRRI